MIRLTRKEAFALLAALLVVIGFALAVGPYQPNQQPNSAANQEAAENNSGLWEWRFSPEALFTGILAVFSIFSYWELRRSSERQLRAYVEIDYVRLDRNHADEHSPWSVLVTLKNFGQTPAHITRFTVERRLSEVRPADELFGFTDQAKEQIGPDGLRIPPQHPHAMMVALREVAIGGSGWMEQREAGTVLYAWGRVEYVDAFNERRYLTFQMQHGFWEVKEFAFCRTGNKSGFWSRLNSRWEDDA